MNMTNESNPAPAASLAALHQAQDKVAGDYAPDPVRSWAGQRFSKLLGNSSNEVVNGVPSDVRDDYEIKLLTYSWHKIPNNERHDNSSIVRTLALVHGELEDEIYDASIGQKKERIVTPGDGLAALGGVAIAAANSVTHIGLAELVIMPAAAVVAYESRTHRPVYSQIDAHTAIGHEADDIQDKVVAELELLGFKDGAEVTTKSVRKDMRRWINRNQKGAKHRFMNKQTGATYLDKKLPIIEDLYARLDSPEAAELNIDIERMYVAEKLFLIEHDGHIENNLKNSRRLRGFGRAAVYTASLLATGLFVLPHLNADQPPVNNGPNTDHPTEVEPRLPVGGGFDIDAND